MLVVYTPAARTAAGSDANLLARINLGVTETNTAYANSGVIPRLRLVGAEAVPYTESGNLVTDLDALTYTADGLIDAVHARRNALGADLVQLMVGDADTAATCGVAWLMPVLSPGFASNAFSVTAYPCISPNYTFGHELGHNMGSHHAPEDGASGALYPYSFGYKHPGNVFRTVMAYNCPGSRLSARAVLLQPVGAVQRAPDRHGGPAQQRPVDQQRAHNRRQLAPGRGHEHRADDLHAREPDHPRGHADIGDRLHRRRCADGSGQPACDGSLVERGGRRQHECRRSRSADPGRAGRW